MDIAFLACFSFLGQNTFLILVYKTKFLYYSNCKSKDLYFIPKIILYFVPDNF
jgi:hypothetical protein